MKAWKASFPRSISEFPTFALVRNGETVQFPDSEAEHVPKLNRDLARLRGFRSVLFTPLMNQGVPVGMISVTRAEPGAFAADHVQLLQTFADQAVIAIENARLFNETRQALERQTATADVLKVIAGSPSDVQPVFEAIVTSANRLIGGFSTAIFRYARRPDPFVSVHSDGPRGRCGAAILVPDARLLTCSRPTSWSATVRRRNSSIPNSSRRHATSRVHGDIAACCSRRS